jgi:hypothetical protein
MYGLSNERAHREAVASRIQRSDETLGDACDTRQRKVQKIHQTFSLSRVCAKIGHRHADDHYDLLCLVVTEILLQISTGLGLPGGKYLRKRDRISQACQSLSQHLRFHSINVLKTSTSKQIGNPPINHHAIGQALSPAPSRVGMV